MTLQPSRRKYRKEQYGLQQGSATRGAKVTLASNGLKAVGRGRLTARQIESARRAMTRHIKRVAVVFDCVFPTNISSKPAEVRAGWVTARVARNTGRRDPARQGSL